MPLSSVLSTLPPSLDAFLDENLRGLAEPPDADWLDIIAEIYGTAPEIVWQGVRAKMPAAPVVPPPFMPPALPSDVVVDTVKRTPSPSSNVPPVQSACTIDTQHPFDRVLRELRARS